ncbi:hypothetical protein KIN20_003528 [Parelaphostrongylus tenuis]|uniref:Uncharacterized protein n=1 Tax=Parelaphostrongylus tenuis TaxID=148309 RepID=A0AAD5QEG5_PARTN|nr:hypothetical protein KIN20_003528 [Parelaphostrongylus tenuis]
MSRPREVAQFHQFYDKLHCLQKSCMAVDVTGHRRRQVLLKSRKCKATRCQGNKEEVDRFRLETLGSAVFARIQVCPGESKALALQLGTLHWEAPAGHV